MVLKCTIEDDFGEIDFLIDPIILDYEDESAVVLTSGKEKLKKLIELPKEAIEKFFRLIPFISKKVLDNVKTLNDNKPDVLNCEFSLGFDISGNIIIAKAGVNSLFKVGLKWTEF